MSPFSGRKAAPTLLAPLVMGILTVPCIYISLDALSYFSRAFSLVALPPLGLSLGYLGWRFFRRPGSQPDRITWKRMDGLGLCFVLFFSGVVSGYTLFSIRERLGLFSLLWAAASLAWLPVMIWRATSLQQRLQAWPRWASLGLLSTLVIALAVLGILYA